MNLKNNVEEVACFHSIAKCMVYMESTKAPESDPEIVLAFYVSFSSLYVGKCCHITKQVPGSDLDWKE
jgi:hypothetical protein